MAKKNSERQRLADQAAKSAHEVVTQLHERAAQMEDEFRLAAGAMVGGAQQDGSALQLNDIEGPVRNVLSFVRENPFVAAAIAVGAGVVLTSIQWDQLSLPRGKTIRPTNKPRGKTIRPTKKPRAKAKAKAGKAKPHRRKPTP